MKSGPDPQLQDAAADPSTHPPRPSRVGPGAPRKAKAAAVAGVDNPRVAQVLREIAALLEAQGDNPFRVGAYRRAADTVARLPRPLHQIYRSAGLSGLDGLPGIGPRIAAIIAELLGSGRCAQHERLRGAADPEALLRTVPGVGPVLAHQLHDELGIDSIEGLEAAAQAGRLEALPGIGARRAAALLASLTSTLDDQRRLRQRTRQAVAGGEPPVETLLSVDEEYRGLAQAGRLPLITPKRFNPDGQARLPVLHTRRGDWSFTALYSNTARAHQLGRTRDWVVIYAERPEHAEQPYTVVTAARGPAAGQRLVRGREAECARLRTAAC